MDFMINFHVDWAVLPNNCKLAYVRETSPGLILLDRIRSETGKSWISEGEMGDSIPIMSEDEITLRISERMARASGRFADTSYERVTVVHSNLNDLPFNRFLSLKVFVPVYENKDTWLGWTMKSEISYKWAFDENAILTEWEKAGFPDRWDLEQVPVRTLENYHLKAQVIIPNIEELVSDED